MQSVEDRTALSEQATAVWETANIKPMATMDREDIEGAWQRAKKALGTA
jgi:hypothetical protein